MNSSLKTMPNGHLTELCVNFFKRAAFLLTLFALTPMASFADTTSITVILSVDEWVNNASEMDLTYDLSDYDLLNSPNMSLDVDSSWFVQADENFTYQLTLDYAIEELHLVITKTSGTSSGTGEVARVHGIIIMDDIMAKQGTLTLTPESITMISPPSISPNPVVKGEGWKFQISPGTDQVELWSPSGQIITRSKEDIAQLIDGDLAPGVYFLRMTVGKRIFHQRIQVVQ